jgi:hypothetical protein
MDFYGNMFLIAPRISMLGTVVFPNCLFVCWEDFFFICQIFIIASLIPYPLHNRKKQLIKSEAERQKKKMIAQLQ